MGAKVRISSKKPKKYKLPKWNSHLSGLQEFVLASLKLHTLALSPLRFSTIDKSSLRTFKVVCFLTDFQPLPNVNQIPNIYRNKDIIFLMYDDFDEHEKMRDVRTILFHPFGAESFVMCQKTKVSVSAESRPLASAPCWTGLKPSN